MNITSILIASWVATAPCFASESAIIGEWKSNGEKTINYLTEHTKLTDQQQRSFKEIFGKNVIIFKPDGTGTMVMPPSTISLIDGKELKLEGRTIEFTYEILGETTTQIVMKSHSENSVILKNRPFSLITLHGRDSYSVSLDDGITELYGREFFDRIEPSEE
ncbi:MAG: hypothetical protein NWT08_06165 [Akkermansiaceae bacterium]|jgi:hypothetical protein|nr:hypothetical protein [Akkermansiaceae bacterium]MDP4847586.1 hypothetical protein [Akkermansiaceae bacterium]MDP4896646.1 hypothetical protein [Akkermansiaceae bacterium]MDP4997264.1 hypothetical protein [Akkermansiaceae bacterium]